METTGRIDGLCLVWTRRDLSALGSLKRREARDGFEHVIASVSRFWGAYGIFVGVASTIGVAPDH